MEFKQGDRVCWQKGEKEMKGTVVCFVPKHTALTAAWEKARPGEVFEWGECPFNVCAIDRYLVMADRFADNGQPLSPVAHSPRATRLQAVTPITEKEWFESLNKRQQ